MDDDPDSTLEKYGNAMINISSLEAAKIYFWRTVAEIREAKLEHLEGKAPGRPGEAIDQPENLM